MPEEYIKDLCKRKGNPAVNKKAVFFCRESETTHLRSFKYPPRGTNFEKGEEKEVERRN